MSAPNRPDRVAGEITAALSQILREGLRDPRVGQITLTSVRITDDLRLARVNFIPLGGQGDPEEIVKGLQSASGYLRRELGNRVHLRYVPELRFHLDTHLDEAMHITCVLDKMIEDRAAGDGGRTVGEGEDTSDQATEDGAAS